MSRAESRIAFAAAGRRRKREGRFLRPLCVAGVYVNESVVNAWKDAGIRDSKYWERQKNQGAGRTDSRDARCVTTVVPIGNEAYNRLYKKCGASTHCSPGSCAGNREFDGPETSHDSGARTRHQRPVCVEKETVARALMSLGREIELIQKHRAEEDLAVAAASILARHEFVTRLAELERQFEIKLPRGASAAVDAAAKEFISKHGVENLPKVAKMHFRTALRAQGCPNRRSGMETGRFCRDG